MYKDFQNKSGTGPTITFAQKLTGKTL